LEYKREQGGKMKRIFVVSLLLLLALPGSVAKMKAQARDEAGIRKVFTGFAEAWAKDDAKTMASYWAADGDLINPQGKRGNGRAEVEAVLAGEHATVFKGTHIKFSEGTIRFVKPDVAVFTTDYEVPGAHGPDGNEMTAKGIVTAVMVKKSGKWWSLSVRPMVPLPPPGQ
jgi:uncharacterized protein (TIGR02246 family)